MNKTLRTIIIAAVILLLTSMTILVFGSSVSEYFEIGKVFGPKSLEQPGEIIATYKGKSVTVDEVEKEIQLNQSQGKPDKMSELEAVNELLLKQIFLVEAENRGLLPTEKEIAAFVAEQKQNYEMYPEAAAAIDEYCKGANITLEEHWLFLEESAPRVIARNKVSNAIFNEYRKANGLKEGALTQEEYDEMDAAYEAYRSELLEKYRDDIIYYLD